jgi:predicted Kef-type K+ transport protein
MELLWIAVAFALGFAARQVGLPALVGLLAAGFVLHGLGVESNVVLDEIADLGVKLLLFTIGLKLQVRTLLGREVWAGASLHMAVTVAVLGAAILLLARAGVPAFAGLELGPSLVLAFALSFSSTVFAMKVLEEKNDARALYGRVAIGILIMQDVIAVAFLAFSSGKVPSLWALGLLALPFTRPLLYRIIDRCGHGEVLLLAGLFLTLACAELFEVVRLKGDLGALVIGVLIANHPRAGELARALGGLKELLLAGFFLTIGLTGAPTLGGLAVALLLTVAVPAKAALFFLLLSRFGLRGRTSFLAALSLANYSEFGLIVGATAAANGWIGPEWLVIVAVAVSITFVAAAPPNTAAAVLYKRFAEPLRRWELRDLHPDDRPIDPGPADFVVLGMGRVGTATYDYLRQRSSGAVVGVDHDPREVERHCAQGRRVLQGDATDVDFWERLPSGRDPVDAVLLAMPTLASNLFAVRQLRERGFPGFVAVTAKYDDELPELQAAGADAVFNLYGEAGFGFAEHAIEVFEARAPAG